MTNRRLIVVCGPPCSGKSTIARALSARTGAIHLELDSILVRLLPGSAHSEKDRDVAYRAMHTIAECLLRSVDEVILDATYAREEPRSDLDQIARRSGASIFIIQCEVPPETTRARFLERKAGHFAVDLNEERVFRLAEKYRYTDSSLILDATQPINQTLQNIEPYLGSWTILRTGGTCANDL